MPRAPHAAPRAPCAPCHSGGTPYRKTSYSIAPRLGAAILGVMEQLLILRDLAVIFGASLVVVLVFHRLRLPALPGFIVAAALSSTAIVLKLLTEKGDIDTPHGRLATGVLIFQDLCVVPMMLALPFLAGRAAGSAAGLVVAFGKAALVVVGVLVAARTVVPRVLAEILKTRSRELFLIAIILVGTLTALGTEAVGASLALGAFLAGLVISESDYAHQAMAELLPFRDIFISLFFVAVGMLVQLDVVLQHPALTFAGVAVLLSGKTLTAPRRPALAGDP